MTPQAWIADLRAAAMLLTRLPVPGARAGEVPDLTRAVWAYPVVGAGVGAIGGGALLGAVALGLPATIAAVLAVAVQMLATGGFHEDGLADMADGVGGGRTRAQKLEIMRDSRLGSYGALAIFLVLIARVEAISILSADPARALAALTAIGALSRGVIVALLAALPSARPQGLGVVAANPPGRIVAAGLVLAVLPGFALLDPVTVLALTLAVALATLAVGWLCRRYLGGYTGDGLGAGQQAGEVAALIALVAGSAGGP